MRPKSPGASRLPAPPPHKQNLCATKKSDNTKKNMQPHDQTQPSPEPTLSQLFFLNLAYTGNVSAEDAQLWHYHALKLQLAFKRAESGLGAEMLGPEETARLELEDQRQIITELGITEIPAGWSARSAVMPHELNDLVCHWAI